MDSSIIFSSFLSNAGLLHHMIFLPLYILLLVFFPTVQQQRCLQPYKRILHLFYLPACVCVPLESEPSVSLVHLDFVNLTRQLRSSDYHTLNNARLCPVACLRSVAPTIPLTRCLSWHEVRVLFRTRSFVQENEQQ